MQAFGASRVPRIDILKAFNLEDGLQKMGMLIIVLLQAGIAYFIIHKIKKHIPGAKIVFEAYPGLVCVALALLAVHSMEGRKYFSVFPFMFAGVLFVTFGNKLYAFMFSLLSGEWRRSWFILDSFAALLVFAGSISSDLIPYAKQGGWLLSLMMIPFVLATISFEGSRAITSRLYHKAQGGWKVASKTIHIYTCVALGLFSNYLLNIVARF